MEQPKDYVVEKQDKSRGHRRCEALCIAAGIVWTIAAIVCVAVIYVWAR